MDNLTIFETEHTPTTTIVYFTYTRMYDQEERLFESNVVVPYSDATEEELLVVIQEKLAKEII